MRRGWLIFVCLLCASIIPAVVFIIAVETHYRRDMSAAKGLASASGYVEFGRDDEDGGLFFGAEWWPALKYWSEYPIRLLTNDSPAQLAHASTLDRARHLIIDDVSYLSEGELTAFIGRFKHLERLHIINAPIRGQCFQPLSQLVSLKELRASGCAIEDEGLQHLAGLKRIDHLVIDHTNVTDDGIDSIANLEIETLDIAHCPITERSARAVAGLAMLRSLNVTGTDFGDRAIEIISQNQQLEDLWLSGTPISDAAVQYLNRFTRCRMLRISDTRITDEGAEAIGPLPDLELLDVSGTAISSLGKNVKKRFPKLSLIIIHSDQFSDETANYLTDQLPDLEIGVSWVHILDEVSKQRQRVSN